MDEFSQILYWLEEAEQVLTELVEKGIDKGTGLVENNIQVPTSNKRGGVDY